MSENDDSKFCDTSGTVGFICPECMQDFIDSKKLMDHFEEVHQKTNVHSLKKLPEATNKSMTSEFEDTIHKQEELINSLRDHNSNLLKRLVLDQKRIEELKSVVNFVLGQYPSNDGKTTAATTGLNATLPRIHDDKDLECQLSQFFENQVEIITTISKVEAYEDDIKKKDAEIMQLKSRNEELVSQVFDIARFRFPIQITSLEASLHKKVLTAENSPQIVVQNQSISVETQTVELDPACCPNEPKQPDSQLIELTNDKLKLETQLSDKIALIANLQTQLQELRVMNKTLSDKWELDRLAQDNLSKQLAQYKLDHQVREDELRSQIEHLTNQLEESKSANDSLKTKYDSLQSETDEFRKSIAKNEGHAEQLNCQLVQKNASLQNELVISKKEADSLMERLIQMEDSNTNLQKEIDAKAHKIRETQIAMMELARENQSLRVMRERDINRQWTKDNEAPTCFTCDKEFSISLRRHHCRHCGNVFCNNCSSHRASIAASKDPVRVCLPCFLELGENQ